MRIAKIAVFAATFAIDRPYDYLVPAHLSDIVAVGMRVIVPFGRGNRQTEGLILSWSKEDAGHKLKTIVSVLDDEPIISAEGIKMAIWMRQRYFCTLYDAFKAMLPAGLWFSLKETYQIAPGSDVMLEYLSEKERAVLSAILDLGGKADCDALGNFIQEPKAALKSLEEKGVLTRETFALRGVKDKSVILVNLAVSGEEAEEYAKKKKKSAPLQFAVIEILQVYGGISAKELCYYTGASMTTLRNLEKKRLISFQQQEVYRRPAVKTAEKTVDFELNEEQEQVFHDLDALCREGKPAVALLYGVTGSGKTPVYIRIIQKTLEHGKTALVLVPEISLTPQLLNRFTSQFGDRVAIMHSSLKVGERYDEWKRIRSKEATVVVGTRSAIFAPLQNLGVIILDEEQEQTYKSENTPRYHARDVAKYLCIQNDAILILGSATPSVETMYFAEKGIYHKFQLKYRYNRQKLPQVMIADMREHLQSGNSGILSDLLQKEISKNIENGEQSILFINRRGSSKLVTCVQCGYVPQCPRCSVTLTYHSANGRLMCHYCGYSEPLVERCNQCGGAVKQVGTGTQKVQQEVESLFPGLKTIRMDTDTVNAQNSHERILDRFEREKIPVLIGTQMVTKGLDFENVTLVGVLDADLSLYIDSYRANERAFSLITQVVGRAGRGEKEGRAVIQTFTPKNRTIHLAANQDYDTFFREEIATRDLRSCPPFADLFTLNFSGGDETAVIKSSVRLREKLKTMLDNRYSDLKMLVLGPAPAYVVKVNNRYRYHLTLSCANNKTVRGLIEFLLKDFAQDKNNKGVSIYADVNAFD